MSISSHFRALHAPGKLLVLPTAWDAATARLMEDAGASAVATSSAAVAWSRGYSDGEKIPLREVLSVVRGIIRVLTVPLSVDLESGYVGSSELLGGVVDAFAAEGVAGINLEDGTVGADEAARRIAAAKATDRVFVNVRIDEYLHPSGRADPFDETLARIRRYEAAGADGIFIPNLPNLDMVACFAEVTSLPLNVWPVPDAALDSLRGAGARRVTFGPGLALMALSSVRQHVRTLLGAPCAEDTALTYARANELFAGG